MHTNKAQLFEHLTSKGFHAADAWIAIKIAYQKPAGAPKVVFISHAISGDVVKNKLLLREVIRQVHKKYPEVVPFCPYYADLEALGEDPLTRERGMRSTRVLMQLGFIDELWITGQDLTDHGVTSGMRQEARWAIEFDIPVVDMRGKL